MHQTKLNVAVDVTKRRLQQMDHQSFEQFVADLWRRRGWTTEVTQQSRDRGVDILAWKEGLVDQSMAIQAKRYGRDTVVSGPDIQQYHALKEQENVDSVAVVTTNRFTSDARDLADELSVKLVDGDDLVALVEETGAEDLAAEHGSHSVGNLLAASIDGYVRRLSGFEPSSGREVAGATLVLVGTIAVWVGVWNLEPWWAEYALYSGWLSAVVGAKVDDGPIGGSRTLAVIFMAIMPFLFGPLYIRKKLSVMR